MPHLAPVRQATSLPQSKRGRVARRRSAMSEFHSEIELMKSHGYSLSQIQAVLTTVDIKVSRTAILNYLREIA